MELQKQLRLFPRPGIQVLQLCFVIEIIGVIKILGLFGTEADARLHFMHLPGTRWASSGSMAPRGHSRAHRPHWVQASVVLGFTGRILMGFRGGPGGW